MADIRINALATTAASTASDDFVAVDGSANGTRKLNAYSPTFGGNLTVSGTGTNSFAGIVSISKALPSDFGVVSIANDLGSSATKLEAGVSGSGRGGTYFGQSEANSSIIFSNGTSSNGLLIGSFNAKQVVIGTNNTAAISINGTTQATTLSGNLTVSGGTLRVQDSTNSYAATITTASAKTVIASSFGGSSVAIRGGGSASDGVLVDSSNNTSLSGNLTVSGGTITSGSGTLTLNSSANTVVLQSAGTTALTLDSSQNATFAGNVTIAASKVFTHNGQNGYTLALSTTADRAFKFEGAASGNDYTTSFTNAGAGKHNLSCSGSIAIGNTVQTAVAVASTHKVTISIGGSTYYLLATNV